MSTPVKSPTSYLQALSQVENTDVDGVTHAQSTLQALLRHNVHCDNLHLKGITDDDLHPLSIALYKRIEELQKLVITLLKTPSMMLLMPSVYLFCCFCYFSMLTCCFVTS